MCCVCASIGWAGSVTPFFAKSLFSKLTLLDLQYICFYLLHSCLDFFTYLIIPSFLINLCFSGTLAAVQRWLGLEQIACDF